MSLFMYFETSSLSFPMSSSEKEDWNHSISSMMCWGSLRKIHLRIWFSSLSSFILEDQAWRLPMDLADFSKTEIGNFESWFMSSFQLTCEIFSVRGFATFSKEPGVFGTYGWDFLLSLACWGFHVNLKSHKRSLPSIQQSERNSKKEVNFSSLTRLIWMWESSWAMWRSNLENFPSDSKTFLISSSE